MYFAILILAENIREAKDAIDKKKKRLDEDVDKYQKRLRETEKTLKVTGYLNGILCECIDLTNWAKFYLWSLLILC